MEIKDSFAWIFTWKRPKTARYVVSLLKTRYRTTGHHTAFQFGADIIRVSFLPTEDRIQPFQLLILVSSVKPSGSMLPTATKIITKCVCVCVCVCVRARVDRELLIWCNVPTTLLWVAMTSTKATALTSPRWSLNTLAFRTRSGRWWTANTDRRTTTMFGTASSENSCEESVKSTANASLALCFLLTYLICLYFTYLLT